MRYVAARPGADAHRCLSGAKAMLDTLMELYGFGSKGCYNPRSVMGGTARSVHAEGRAIDVAVDNAPGLDQVMLRVADQLTAFHENLGVQCIIYRTRIWTCDRQWWRPYTGTAGPHLDHAHVELHPSRADNLTRAEIVAVLAPRPQPIPPEQTEDDMATHLYKDPRYENVWVMPSGDTVTGEEVAGPYAGLPTITSAHDQRLANLCWRAWGATSPADATLRELLRPL